MREAWPLLLSCVLVACSDSSVVAPPDASACSVSLSLRPGDVQSLSGASALSCIGLPAASTAQEYLYVATNASTGGSDVWTYLVGSALDASGVSPSVTSTLRRESALPIVGTDFEDGLRRRERALLGGRSIGALGRAAEAQGVVRALVSRASPAVGDVVSYRVGDASSTAFCSTYSTVQAVVKAVGQRAIVAIDQAAPPGFSDDDFKAVAAEFDQIIYPVDAQWFGNATDINGDQRVTILYTPLINRLSPPGASFVGGFFFVSDLLPRSIPAQQWRCDASNEQEIIYLLAPDPNGTINGNRNSLTSAMEATRGTLAHELQHMINQGVRQNVTRANLEVPWLNEGLSHLAEELVGRAERGYGDYRKLTWSDALADLDDFDAFFRQNLLRLRAWMEQPHLYSPIGQDAGKQLAPRGAAWALLRYSIDQYSQGNAKAFVRALVAGPEVDVQNLEARARVPFAELLPGFLIASSGQAASSGASRYAFTGLDVRDLMLNLNGGAFPLRVQPMPSLGTGRSPSGSASYFTVTRPAGAAATAIRLRAAGGGAVDNANGRVYVLRVK